MPNKIRFIHKIRVQKNLVFKHQEQRFREICEIRVPKNIRFIRKIRVQTSRALNPLSMLKSKYFDHYF